MKGMYCTEWYPWLSEQNPSEFEERLIKWAKRTKGTDVMLFDQDTIVVGKATEVDGWENIYRIELTRIIIEYICLNGNMCVLRKVFWKDQEKGEPLYELPNSWAGSIPHYAY